MTSQITCHQPFSSSYSSGLGEGNPIIQTLPHGSRSNRYHFISTLEVVEALEKKGFQVEHARAARASEAYQGFQRHEVQFGSSALPVDKVKRMQLSLVNSHNGKSGFSFGLRVFVKVCSNGLYCFNQLAGVKLRHAGKGLESLGWHVDQVLDQAARVWALMGSMEAVCLDPIQQEQFAARAVGLRWDSRTGPEIPYDPKLLLEGFRLAQQDATVWNVYNRVQSNLLQGQEYRVLDEEGRPCFRKTRRITALDRELRINRSLFELAASYVH